jgi:hypothetical protein
MGPTARADAARGADIAATLAGAWRPAPRR